jgi:hypothetical protein
MIKTIALAVLLMIGGRSAAFPVVPADTVKADTVKTDSVKAERKVTKHECCADTTVNDHKDPYHKLVKEGGSVNEGLFTVRHIKDNWYLEVPESLLGRLLLAVTRFESVPQGFKLISGEEVNHSTVFFERYNDQKMFLREYVQTSFAKEDNSIGNALKMSTVDPVVGIFNIIGTNPDNKAMLVDITKFVLSDNKVIGINNSDRTILGIGTLQTDRTFVDTIMVYPINMNLKTLRTYAMTTSRNVPASATGSVTLTLNTSFVELPETPMRPRLSDERVGYFNNSITQFSDDDVAEHEAVISRYRLEPKDEKAYKAGKLVEPKKQIVYYIDPATPKKWVKYLKQGINDWNTAFEAAGFKNAIVAKDWPDDPTMSLDDARFSVLRYLPSESENAYGPRIVDPRSGEIIEAHICWYHNVMQLLKKWYMTQCGPLDKRAQTMDFDDELMGQLIRFVSSHEVGHTLGLRHNMMASAATPVEKLRDKAWLEQHGHTASIMDYARFNWVAQPEDKVGERGLFPRINDYDKWAVKWGYQWRPEFKDPYQEKKALRSEVTKALQNPRLRWIGDEGKGSDPRSQAEDLGDNHMKSTEYGIKNMKRVVANLAKWTAQPDGQYDDLDLMYKTVRAQFTRYMMSVQRYVNGHYTNNWPAEHRYAPVPRKLQKEAIEWFGRNVFVAPLWLYPDDIVGNLKMKGTDTMEEIQNHQMTTITSLLSAGSLYNQRKAAFQSSDPYPIEEYLNDVFAAVWKPLNDTDERQNYLSRQMQRTYIANLGQVINPTANNKELTGISLSANRSDVVLYVLQHLDKVEDYLKEQQATGINGQHYHNLLLQIKKIREKYESGKN